MPRPGMKYEKKGRGKNISRRPMKRSRPALKKKKPASRRRSRGFKAIELTDADFEGINDWEDLENPFPDTLAPELVCFEKHGCPGMKDMEDPVWQPLMSDIQEWKPKPSNDEYSRGSRAVG